MLLSEHLGLKIKCSLEHGFNLKYQELFSRLHHGWGGDADLLGAAQPFPPVRDLGVGAGGLGHHHSEDLQVPGGHLGLPLLPPPQPHGRAQRRQDRGRQDRGPVWRGTGVI